MRLFKWISGVVMRLWPRREPIDSFHSQPVKLKPRPWKKHACPCCKCTRPKIICYEPDPLTPGSPAEIRMMLEKRDRQLRTMLSTHGCPDCRCPAPSLTRYKVPGRVSYDYALRMLFSPPSILTEEALAKHLDAVDTMGDIDTMLISEAQYAHFKAHPEDLPPDVKVGRTGPSTMKLKEKACGADIKVISPRAEQIKYCRCAFERTAGQDYDGVWTCGWCGKGFKGNNPHAMKAHRNKRVACMCGKCIRGEGCWYE